MSLTYAGICYENVLRHAGVTTVTDMIEDVGFELTNSYDWLSWTSFKANATALLDTITITRLNTDFAVDTCCVYFNEVMADIVGLVVTVTDVGGATTYGTYTVVATDNQVVKIPLSASADLVYEVHITPASVPQSVNIGQIFLGEEWIITEMGQHQGIRPPFLFSGPILDTVISENGSLLVSNVTRGMLSGNIDLEPVSAAWVRDRAALMNWQAFIRHTAKHPCFYSWAANIPSYATETVWAKGSGIPAAENTRLSKMGVKLPLIIEDSSGGI